ncbi:MAG: hypothetical protein A2W93_04575 [Bacteroidetes bacterium GWF2_43_63]|nr:MAG: hypothetical protein A2W94_12565 [Bacteroidetes bacterium GWE2_42_42]OFY56036.1 MAG: hypothetical protein A2W93_04575 [Bacteroidetes bacterium GWF2_43_63]HBG70719.1 hypothetical protein [Bacteroidales bacterium]HCB62453.1 hypothetical protein [Bacteroidales bacterium]HCY21908.1 hypothetical protein [Bacteroidales bacterium]
MSKNIFALFLFSALTLSQVFAQGLLLSDDKGPIANNSIINVWGDSANSKSIFSNIDITNSSASHIEVLVKKTEVSVVPGSENSFCWGTCLPSNVFLSTTPILIGSRTTNKSSFTGEYKPLNNNGTTTIRYTFFNQNDISDSVAITVIYNAVTAIADEIPVIIDFSNAYPNPAATVANFNYEFQSIGYAELVISDLLGSEIHKTVLHNEKNKLSVDVSSFIPGVYFYSLRVDGKLYFTRKLIVRH